MTEQIHGLTLSDHARINSKHTELQTQFGERDFKPHLQAFLAEQGIDENTWASSWNAWWERMESDSTGKLHARFAMLQQELILAAHMGDVPDASGDVQCGVTLDSYAQIMARIAGGEDYEAVLAEHDLPLSQWQEAQTAWNAVMAEDIGVTTQYGQLYAKHSPGHAERMEAQIAAQVAAAHDRDDTEEEEVEYTFADFVRELDASDASTRFSAAHHVINHWDLGEKDDPAVDAAARRAHQLALECLGSYDRDTVSEAEALARDLVLFASEGFLTPAEAGRAKAALQGGLEAGEQKLAKLKAEFAPIADKRVPERVHLQSAIQDFTSITEELTEMVEEWDDNYEPPGEASPSMDATPAAASSSSSSSRATPAQAPAAPNPLLILLRSLPVIGPILRTLGI